MPPRKRKYIHYRKKALHMIEVRALKKAQSTADSALPLKDDRLPNQNVHTGSPSHPEEPPVITPTSDTSLEPGPSQNIASEEEAIGDGSSLMEGLLRQTPKNLSNVIRSCMVSTCLKTETTHPERTFFSLPFDTVDRMRWCKYTGREDVFRLPFTQACEYYLCDSHFEKRYVVNAGLKVTLLKNAIPTLEVPITAKKNQNGNTGFQCSVLKCTNNSKDNPNLKFFLVPNKKERYSIWFRNMGITPVQYPFRISRYWVCQDHFEKRYIKLDQTGNHVLMPLAEPTINLPVPYEQIKNIKPQLKLHYNLRRTSSTPSKTPQFKKSDNITATKSERALNKRQLDTLESADLTKVSAKRKKIIQVEIHSEEDQNDEGNSEESEGEDNDDSQEYNDNNEEEVYLPLDRVDDIQDSLADASLKTEPVEHEDLSALDATTSENVYTYVNIAPGLSDIAISSNISSSNEQVVSAVPGTVSVKERLKLLYTIGTPEIRLIFDLCDRYCRERTNGTLQMKKEILS